MKKYFYTPVLVVLLTSLMAVRAQDQEYLGLPGDNLNLFAVMDLFQNSETLEGFERSLNDDKAMINNLDLNGDGYVDYIRVIDNVERNVHFIVLQVAVSPRENQDVAVFTVVRQSDGNVQIQLVGDEALYGRNYIVEPIYDETPNPGYTGNARRVNGQRVNVVHTTTYQIAAWPVIRFIYTPTYVVWHSPWRWDYYPAYWTPWNSYYWHYYYGYHYNYYPHYYSYYRHWNNHRYDHWHDSYYVHHHTKSVYVHSRINDGYYKKTYTRPELRNEGTALYRTRSANDSRAGVPSYGTRRTSSGSSVRSNENTRTREGASSGTRTSGNRQASGTSTRTSGNREATGTSTRTSGNREATGTSTRTSGNREATGTSTRTSGNREATGTSTRTSGNREATGTSTRTSGNREATGTSTRTSGNREAAPSENRSTGSRESTSSGTTNRSVPSTAKQATRTGSAPAASERRAPASTQRTEKSASGGEATSGRRSGSGSSSGTETRSSEKTSKSTRTDGRR